jgi:peptidoglycan/xylan/chitin deacetylase (PgdA/CDA1 family)
MTDAEWILTFDDGPLPADVVKAEGLTDGQLLDPLKRIIAALADHPEGPMPAVFFVRGPAYPWPSPPPKRIFRKGIQMILEAGHHVGIHCHRHDPDLWWGWLFRGPEIHDDLDRCVAYFEPLVGRPMTTFRPPYGQGGFPAFQWAAQQGIKYHLVDLDPEDWRHHPDARLLRRFVNAPQRHLRHMRAELDAKLWMHTLRPGARDVLFHVSIRTADFLPRLLDHIVELTRRLGRTPRFVVPQDYLSL